MRLKNLPKNFLTNTGGDKDVLFLCPIAWIDAEAKPVDTALLIEGDNDVPGEYEVFANEAARDTAIAAPSGGETVYLTNRGIFQRYITSAWVRISPVLISQAHTAITGKGFLRIEVTKDKNSEEVETPEELDVTGKVFKPRFALPTHSIDNLEFERMLNQYKFIMMRPNNDGEIIQYGTVESPVDIRVVEMPKGAMPTEYKGMIFEATYYGSSIIHYQSTIPLHP